MASKLTHLSSEAPSPTQTSEDVTTQHQQSANQLQGLNSDIKPQLPNQIMLNKNSENELSVGQAPRQFQSQKKMIQLPQIGKNMGPGENSVQQFQSLMHSVGNSNENFNQASHKSKPFLKGAIIEEVTKEHFFTKDQRRNSMDNASASSGSYRSSQNSKHAPQPLNHFQQRSRSLLPQAQKDAQINHEKLKKTIPKACKVICFCNKKELQANHPGLQSSSNAFNRQIQGSRNATNSQMSSKASKIGSTEQQIPDGSTTGTTFFKDLCQHSGTTEVNTVYNIISSQIQALRSTDTTWRAHLDIAGGNLDKVQFVRGANYVRQLSDVVRGQEGQIGKLYGEVDKQGDLETENQLLKEQVQDLQIQVVQLSDRLKSEDQSDAIAELQRTIVDSQTRFQLTLAKLKQENKRTKQFARQLVTKEEHLSGALVVGERLYKILNKSLASGAGTNMGIINKQVSRELEENFGVLKHIRAKRQEIDANLREMMEKIEHEVHEQTQVRGATNPLQRLQKDQQRKTGFSNLDSISERSYGKGARNDDDFDEETLQQHLHKIQQQVEAKHQSKGSGTPGRRRASGFKQNSSGADFNSTVEGQFNAQVQLFTPDKDSKRATDRLQETL